MKAWKDKSTIDNLSDRLDRLEANNNNNNAATNEEPDELVKLSPMEKYELKFNWYVKQIMPYYKAEVMSVHTLTSEEYDRRTLEGDQSIYLPHPSRRFLPTSYKDRVAHVLGLDYQGLQDKIARGEIKVRIATGLVDAETGRSSWRDEDPNAVF